ncbi:hypothetical protein [Acinetobacter sp.]|uniref:hypothetical protein n=1 Tax=Acinetobacter sp. TaxID=472 RepID=UPI003341FE44
MLSLYLNARDVGVTIKPDVQTDAEYKQTSFYNISMLKLLKSRQNLALSVRNRYNLTSKHQRSIDTMIEVEY